MASMAHNSDVDLLLERIMTINVLRMGGAAAAIAGSAGADGVLVNSLKRSAAAFANEYQKTDPSHDTLARLATEISGPLQTLVVMGTLSREEADLLTDQLQTLTDTV